MNGSLFALVVTGHQPTQRHVELIRDDKDAHSLTRLLV
jgi:hypothetical protein